MLSPVAIWLFAILSRAAPVDRVVAIPTYPEAVETADERTARYHSIAADLYAVVYDAEVQPIWGLSRRDTAEMILATAYHESGFAKDVDLGPACAPGRIAKKQCDGGASACMMQIRVGDGATIEGWTKADLFGDRQKCFRAGLRILDTSVKACRRNPLEHRFAVYTSGSCTRGLKQSAEIVALRTKIVAGVPALRGLDVDHMIDPGPAWIGWR